MRINKATRDKWADTELQISAAEYLFYAPKRVISGTIQPLILLGKNDLVGQPLKALPAHVERFEWAPSHELNLTQ